MTRKDYVAIAAAMYRTRPTLDRSVKDARGFYAQHLTDCDEIALTLARDNPRFDRARFLKACWVQS